MKDVLAGSGAFYLFMLGIALFMVLIFMFGRSTAKTETPRMYRQKPFPWGVYWLLVFLHYLPWINLTLALIGLGLWWWLG